MPRYSAKCLVHVSCASALRLENRGKAKSVYLPRATLLQSRAELQSQLRVAKRSSSCWLPVGRSHLQSPSHSDRLTAPLGCSCLSRVLGAQLVTIVTQCPRTIRSLPSSASFVLSDPSPRHSSCPRGGGGGETSKAYNSRNSMSAEGKVALSYRCG